MRPRVRLQLQGVRAVSGEPAAHSRFVVYLGDDALTFVKDPCVPDDVWYSIRMRAVPEDLKDLPRWRYLRYRSDNLSFTLSFTTRVPMIFEGKCIAVLPLPDYPVSRVRTGQPPDRRPGRGRHPGWQVEIGSPRRPEPSHGG